MRRLLVITVIGGLALAASLWQTPDAEAASVWVTAHLYHPAGNPSYSALLTCGWHNDCRPPADASGKGLDWIYQNNASYTVWVRIKAYGATTTPQLVTTGVASNSTSGCKRIIYRMYRYSDGSWIGSVENQHAQATSTSYANLLASISGYNNAAVVGTMLASGDNCATTGRHVMDWYANVSATGVAKNTQIPTEAQCSGCYTPYGIWTTREYAFGFNS